MLENGAFRDKKHVEEVVAALVELAAEFVGVKRAGYPAFKHSNKKCVSQVTSPIVSPIVFSEHKHVVESVNDGLLFDVVHGAVDDVRQSQLLSVSTVHFNLPTVLYLDVVRRNLLTRHTSQVF